MSEDIFSDIGALIFFKQKILAAYIDSVVDWSGG